jgi:hypothetical protein
MATKQEILDKIQNRQCVEASEIAELFIAELFMDLVNGGGDSRGKDFAEVVCNENRFLQSEAFNLFIHCIEGWAEAYKKGRFDGRNEHVCELSNLMIEGLKASGRW